MSGKKLTPEETVSALRCCGNDYVLCSSCPARVLPDCSITVKLRAAELLEKNTSRNRWQAIVTDPDEGGTEE